MKKIISLLLLAAMLFSVLLMSSCHKENGDESENSEESDIVLTPKEKFLEVGKNASAYFKELSNSFGFDTNMAAVPDGKMETTSFAVKLNKLSSGGQSIITEPVSLSGEIYSDVKNNIKRTLGKLEMNGETVRFEYLLGASAAYLNLNKVTERILKFPLQTEGQSEGFNAGVKANEYIDYFMDNLNDELFAAQSGKVTVDGVEFDGETVTLRATAKQFAEAIVKVLEKAKTDEQIVGLLKMLNITSISGNVDNLSEAIDKAIESLKEDINSAKDDDTVAITVISEKGVLRSFELASVEDGKKHTASLTTTVKNGTYYVKGSIKEDEAALIDFSYQQKPNDKGGADGELNMTIDVTTKTDESDDTSGDTSETESGIGNELLNLDKFTVNVTFSGQKTDNKVAIDGKLEISTNQGGLTVTIPINIAVKYEKVSDLENKYSINLSFNIMGTEADLSISGGRSVIEYTAAQIPGDDAVDVVGDNFDYTTLLTKLMTEYPGIGEWLTAIFGAGVDKGDPVNQTGKYIYNENEDFTAYLYDNGTGWFCPVLYDVNYKDGKYTAKLYDGSELDGEYVLNGNSIVIDDVGGYTYIKEDGRIVISNDEVGSYITFYEEDVCMLETYFQYKIENGKIKIQLSTGGVFEATYKESGNKVTIGNSTFNVIDMTGESDANT